MKTHTSQPFYNRSADSRGKYPRNSLTAPLCTFISINPPDEKVKYYSAGKNLYCQFGLLFTPWPGAHSNGIQPIEKSPPGEGLESGLLPGGTRPVK